MKNKIVLAIAVAASVAFPSVSNASLTLTLTPSSQTVNVGGQASVDVWVDHVKSTGSAVGAFALFLNFDGGLLSTPVVSFGSQVNDFQDSGLASANQMYAGNTSFADVADLLANQPDRFKLVTFTFQTLQRGTSHLTIDPTSSISDASGMGILDFNSSEATVTAVPEPGTYVAGLVLVTLAGVSTARRRLVRA